MSDAEFAALESVTIEARFAEDDEITIRYELAEGEEDKGKIVEPDGGVCTFHLSEVDDGDNHLPGNSRGNPMLDAKEGYAFDRWTLKQDAGFLSYDKEFQPTIEDVAGATQWSNRSYVAHFVDDKQVTFHYKVAEGQEHMGQIDKPEGGSDEFWISKEPELARASAKDGYVFDHWSLEGDGTFYGDDEDLSPSKGDAAGGEWNDRSYVAHFVENKEITIRYEVAEGQEHMGVIVDPEGGSQTGKISNLQWSLMGVAEAKRGYAFDHWSLEGDGTFYGDDEYLNPAKKDAEDRLWSDRSYVAHFVRDFGGSDPKLSIGASIDETYDGAPRKIEANMAKPLAGDFIEYSTDGSTWSAECPEFADVALDGDGNAVERTIYARVTNGEKHTKPVSATLMIRMRPLSITPASYSVTYDGQLHGLKPDSPISAKQGLVDGHTLDEAKLGAKTSFGPSVSFDNVLEIDPDSVQIMSGGDDVTENYEITLETGLLTINYASLMVLFNDGKLEVSAIPDQTYTGAPIEPAFTMRHSGMTIVKDVDYSPSYSDNINVGMGAVSVNGMGNYLPEGGNIRLDFKIVPQAAALNVRQSGRVWSEGMSIDEAAIRALFDVNDASGKPLDGNLYTVRVTDEAERPVNLPITQPGVYAITATLTTDNYRFKEGGAEKAAASFDYSLLPKLELHFEGKTFTYDGAAHFLPAAVCEGATITYALSENAPEAERYESIESAALGLTETGSVTIYARAEKARYAPLTASAVLEVAKRPITIVASDNRADYDGQPHGAQPAQPFFVSDDEGMGLAPGDAVDANRVVIPASKTDAGAYAGLLEIGAGLKILNGGAQANVTENYEITLKPGTLTIARKLLDAQDVSVDAIPDQTYAGAAIEPALSVRHGAMTLVAGRDYTASYADNVNAGAAKVIVAGMGNYAGERTVDFTIVPQNAALEVKENRRAWREGMSLDEAAIRARFEVNDANGRPLDSNLYTVRVMQNGADAKLPIVNAGNYTVEVALNTQNYALSEPSFGYTIEPLPFGGSVSMNGYVYGETPSQPKLNGYDGDGKATFYYRPEGTIDWPKWENITSTSLAPGNYEIEAVVEDTTNHAGGRTQPARFSVSRAELGAAVRMQDYVYGGSVPAPALVPEIPGLSVEWFYSGADGVEKPWANISEKTLSAGGYTMIAKIAQSSLYEATELRASFTVERAAAPAIQWPTAGGITYGQPVSAAKLSAESDAFGTFAWANPGETLHAGERTATLNYTPNDARNYDYSGVTLSREIAISVAAKPLDGGNITVESIPDQTCTGQPIAPKLTVKDGEKLLVEGADYSVRYADNINAGTATVTISGMGDYAGELTVKFVIRAAKEDEAAEEADAAAEPLAPVEQAEKLSRGEAVGGIVTDQASKHTPYETSIEEILDESAQEVLERTLVFTALPLLDEDGAPILKDGEPVYEQRNLHLSRALLDALADKGYTHIRFKLQDTTLEWRIADMGADGCIVRLAPMEESELSQAERAAIDGVEVLSGLYRVRVTAMLDGEETNVTDAIPSLTAVFDAESVRPLSDTEAARLLLVPGDGEPEEQVFAARYIEPAQTGKARYAAAITESGLFLLIRQ